VPASKAPAVGMPTVKSYHCEQWEYLIKAAWNC